MLVIFSDASLKDKKQMKNYENISHNSVNQQFRLTADPAVRKETEVVPNPPELRFKWRVTKSEAHIITDIGHKRKDARETEQDTDYFRLGREGRL